jgi:hypothetical protein
MPRQRFDIGSKFLVQKQGRALLLLGGAKNVRSVKAMQAEMVQQKKLPDGLPEVYFEKQKKTDNRSGPNGFAGGCAGNCPTEVSPKGVSKPSWRE